MDNITSLLQKFSKKSVDVHTIESANASNVSIAEAMFENWMTIVELVDYDNNKQSDRDTIILFVWSSSIYFVNCETLHVKQWLIWILYDVDVCYGRGFSFIYCQKNFPYYKCTCL